MDRVLYAGIVRLAYEEPSLTAHLLPLIRKYARSEVVTYKGRPYTLLWSGKTRYGERAKLQFLDGSKEFWVDLSLISKSRAAPSGPVDNRNWPSSGPCPVCRRRHRYSPCGYPGCRPNYCDECDGGGRYCNGY